jgi:hypothetical protein
MTEPLAITVLNVIPLASYICHFYRHRHRIVRQCQSQIVIQEMFLISFLQDH